MDKRINLCYNVDIMKVKNNYNECPTNLACSIRKYFGLNYRHQTLPFIDATLEKEKPKNVVLILLDGMGANIMGQTLPENSFFRKNLIKDITSVFPATTTAATTSIRTGLNPIEHGWLGWNMYVEPIDKIITLFLNSEKGKEGVISQDFLKVKSKLVSKTIVDEINEKNEFEATELLPFGENPYNGLDQMLNEIASRANGSRKQFIYAYDDEPDHTMHDFGPNHSKSKALIIERNEKIETLCSALRNTLVIITADHGHKKVKNIFLKDYPEILHLLERSTSLEQRAVSFKIKNGGKKEFVELFNKLFGDAFRLYSKDDIVSSKLFGDGVSNELFIDAIGDFIAIAYDSDKALVANGDDILASQHAGYSDDEIFVPIIVKMCR